MSELYNQVEDQVLAKVYLDANVLAINNSQTIGEKNDYYITLEQLGEIIKDIQAKGE